MRETTVQQQATRRHSTPGLPPRAHSGGTFISTPPSRRHPLSTTSLTQHHGAIQAVDQNEPHYKERDRSYESGSQRATRAAIGISQHQDGCASAARCERCRPGVGCEWKSLRCGMEREQEGHGQAKCVERERVAALGALTCYRRLMLGVVLAVHAEERDRIEHILRVWVLVFGVAQGVRPALTGSRADSMGMPAMGLRWACKRVSCFCKGQPRLKQ